MPNSFYKTLAQDLASDETEAESLFQAFSGKAEPAEATQSGSFSDKELETLAYSAAGEGASRENAQAVIGAYKAMYRTRYGTLAGAFTQAPTQRQGEAYSASFENLLWTRSEDGIADLPEMRGYLLNCSGEGTAADAPAPPEDSLQGWVDALLAVDGDYLNDVHFSQAETPEISQDRIKASLKERFQSLSNKEMETAASYAEGDAHEVPEQVQRYAQSRLDQQALSEATPMQLMLARSLTVSGQLQDSLAKEALSRGIPDWLGGEPVQNWLQGRGISPKQPSEQPHVAPQKQPQQPQQATQEATQEDGQVQGELSQGHAPSQAETEAFQLLGNQESYSQPVVGEQQADITNFQRGVEAFSNQEGKMMLKVPLATLGEWQRGNRKVRFTQKDFDEIKQNFESGALGFEPDLTRGHQSNIISVDGAPATAFLTRIEQQGKDLFGHYEVVDESVFEDVQSGKYRYASSEILRNSISKKSGKPIGSVLIGAALTNRPFIPDMERVQTYRTHGAEVYSNTDTADQVTYRINSTMPPEQTPSQEETNIPEGTQESPAPQQNQDGSVTLSQQEFQNLVQRLSQMENEVSTLREREQTREKQRRESSLEQLNLSQETKDMIKPVAERLGDEDYQKLYNAISGVSAERAEAFTTQAGEQTETETRNQEEAEKNSETGGVHPIWKGILERNQDRAKNMGQPYA